MGTGQFTQVVQVIERSNELLEACSFGLGFLSGFSLLSVSTFFLLWGFK